MPLRDLLRRSAGLAPVETRALSIADPALAQYLGVGSGSSAGQVVSEQSALGLTALYRAVSLIAGTLAALPWKTYRTGADDSRERVRGLWVDDPGAPAGLTPYAWRELVYTHLTMWGNFYGGHEYGGAGQLLGLTPIHPSAVEIIVDRDTGARVYRVRLANGQTRDLRAGLELTHIMGLTTDGVRGLSPLTIARNAIGAGLAGDDAAARMFANGAFYSGMVTTQEDVEETEAVQIAEGIRNMAGTKTAGEILFVNRNLTFSSWAQSHEDAQFLESRAFQVEEIARFYGLPKVLLAEDGASTWGSGIAELVRGLEKFTFRPWAARVEAALAPLLPENVHLELDFAGLLAPSESEATANALAEVAAGTLTIDEYRRIKNRPPLARTPDPEVVA